MKKFIMILLILNSTFFSYIEIVAKDPLQKIDACNLYCQDAYMKSLESNSEAQESNSACTAACGIAYESEISKDPHKNTEEYCKKQCKKNNKEKGCNEGCNHYYR